MAMSSLLFMYRRFARYGGPALARRMLARRALRGKEDPNRLDERFGVPTLPRPQGELIWLHAASVGEALSLLPLINGIRKARPDLETLVTTGTVSSAMLMAERLPEGAAHQYAPIDTIAAVESFLDYWQPSFCGIVESEIWPTMLEQADRRDIPIALISARVSENSAKRWRRYAPGTIKLLLNRFSLILAQNDTVAERLVSLGANPRRLGVCGALKDAATPLPVSDSELTELRAILGNRPRWMAASTHTGEESAAITAHEQLRGEYPQILTMIAPRHPERADAIAAEARERGWHVARRSEGAMPQDGVDIYLIDTLGELGLWYRLAPVTFVGGSLSPVGGHNPLEPARLGSTILHGPHYHNFLEEYKRLQEAEGAREVRIGERLGAAVAELLNEDGEPNAAARALSEKAFEATLGGDAVVARVLSAITPLLPPELYGEPEPYSDWSFSFDDDDAAA
ncbi:MAG: 3-deoxy-D-manno-octulosonic acid transferase [Neomegalonema sp.]|nr:3-deoxy-D-manno-octulosonic acid transferase [Neomegalonema sp.]